MLNETEISLKQIKAMIHAIGFRRDKVKRGKYIALLNYYCLYEPGEDWEKLVQLGLATKNLSCDSKATYYHVSDDGLMILSRLLDVRIIEDKE
jgi:hypothetical protein